MNINNVSFGRKNNDNNPNNAKAFIAGITVNSAIVAGVMPINKKIMKSMTQIDKNYTADELNTARIALDNALDKSGLKDIVQLQRINENTLILGNSNPTIEQVKKGINACYFPSENRILLHDTKLQLAGFHEIGHAMNNNLSKVAKFLQKMRMPSMAATGLVGLYAVFAKGKENDGDLSAKDKFTNFVRNNAGKLSFLCFAPVIAEEALATRNGNKLAKLLLNNKMYNDVVKSNRLGLVTYAILGIATGIAAMAGKKVADIIRSKND